MIYNFLIAENIPSLNKGEMTILDGMLASFNLLHDVNVSMLSPHCDIDRLRYSHKIKIIDTNHAWHFGQKMIGKRHTRLFISILIMLQHLFFLMLYKISRRLTFKIFTSSIWKEYSIADVVIEGHNGTFGIGGNDGIPYFYLLYLPIFIRALGKPIVFYGGSIKRYSPSSFFGKLFNKLLHFALNNIDLITLRESVSFQNLTFLGVNNTNVRVTADPAFLLHSAPGWRVDEIMKRENVNTDKKIVGVTVSYKRACQAFPKLGPANSYVKHNDLMAKIIDDIIQKYNANVVFIPHCIGYGKLLDDRLVAYDVYQKCHNKSHIKLINNEYDAAELKGIIGRFDFFIGERLHSVINALSMGIPSLVILSSKDQRLDILRMIQLDYMIFFIERFNNELLFNTFSNLFFNRNEIKNDIFIKIEKVKERAMINGKLLKILIDNQK